MSRNLVLALGVLLWTSFAIVSILHAIAGDPMGPLVAVVVVTTVVAVRHLRRWVIRPS